MKTLSVGVAMTTALSNDRHDTFLLLAKRDFDIYGFLRKSSVKLSKLKLMQCCSKCRTYTGEYRSVRYP